MSWEKLNNHELQACRKLLMLDVSEAAELIGKVSPRTWQYWESGRSAVPDDVDMEMYGLIGLRNSMIEAITDEFEEGSPIPYFHYFDEFSEAFPDQNKVTWRLLQSAASYVFCEGGDVQLTSKAEIDTNGRLYQLITVGEVD